jgi:hypothetical protein
MTIQLPNHGQGAEMNEINVTPLVDGGCRSGSWYSS